MRVINNTDLSIVRLLYLYDRELLTVRHHKITCIVFDLEKMVVYGANGLLLYIDDQLYYNINEDSTKVLELVVR